MLMHILGETQQTADCKLQTTHGELAMHKQSAAHQVFKLTVSTPLLRITSTGMLFIYCSTGMSMILLAATRQQHSSGLQ